MKRKSSFKKKLNPSPAFSEGAWFEMNYAGSRRYFYISKTDGDVFNLSVKGMGVDSPIWLTRRQMESADHRAVYIGHGKRKWYRTFLPWKSIVDPFKEPEPIKNTSYKMSGRRILMHGFMLGSFASSSLLMFWQDFVGKEAYISHLEENWIDLSPLYGAGFFTLFLLAMILSLVKLK